MQTITTPTAVAPQSEGIIVHTALAAGIMITNHSEWCRRAQRRQARRHHEPQ